MAKVAGFLMNFCEGMESSMTPKLDPIVMTTTRNGRTERDLSGCLFLNKKHKMNRIIDAAIMTVLVGINIAIPAISTLFSL